MKTHKKLIWNEKELDPKIKNEIEGLPELTVDELRHKYREVLGYDTHSRNRQFLIRKLIWGIQVREFGDISDDARKKAHELADFRFLRIRLSKYSDITIPSEFAGRAVRKKVSFRRDPRLPMVGAIVTKEYEGTRHDVQVLDDGFEYEGQRFKSLSSVARKITGTNWNGFTFFGLGGSK